MPATPGFAAAEIELERAVHQKRRRNDPYLVDQFVAHDPAKRIEIKLPARGQRARQIHVADEDRFHRATKAALPKT